MNGIPASAEFVSLYSNQEMPMPVPGEKLSEAQLKEALDDCAKEPIHIPAKSELGKDAEFIEYFDLQATSENSETNISKDDELESAVGTRFVILLIEDYESNIMVASYYLEHLGYDFEIARSGVEAVEKFKLRSYYALLMDIQMPELNGFDATKLIRQYETSQNLSRTPIIGMTAHAMHGYKERCIEAGMDDYIAKPVDLDELKGKLESFMDYCVE